MFEFVYSYVDKQLMQHKLSTLICIMIPINESGWYRDSDIILLILSINTLKRETKERGGSRRVIPLITQREYGERRTNA